MVDQYLWGEVDRISPEAPVPVVSISRDTCTLGGAGNVVNNLAAMNVKVAVASVIGTGKDAEVLVNMFQDLGVDASGLIQDPERPTTRKTRVIAGHQQLLRIDHETAKEITELQVQQLIHYVEKRIDYFSLVLISDYGKGVLPAALVRRVITLASQHNKITIVDPKGFDYSKYAGATIITPNKKEASLAAGMEITDDDSLQVAGEKLLHQVPVRNVLITCGKDGMALFQGHEPALHIASEAKQVFDVSGAGDTVVAILGAGLAAGLSVEDAASVANVAAGVVVGKLGTATLSPQELGSALLARREPFASKKLRSLSELAIDLTQARSKGKKIVMTNGCFDLLHVGHIKLLSESKRMGDILVVAIDDDESVRALKGGNRPVVCVHERVSIISALDCVDYVTVFAAADLAGAIAQIRPDILTKGSNYTIATISGSEIVEGYGGSVVLVPITEQTSSTQIIDQIKRGE